LSINDEDPTDNPDTLAGDRDLTIGTAHDLTLEGVKSAEDSDASLKAEGPWLCPIQEILGGLTLGSVCVTSDMLGIMGVSQGMLIATSIIRLIDRQIYDLRGNSKRERA
jgi:hypothetical protein